MKILFTIGLLLLSGCDSEGSKFNVECWLEGKLVYKNKQDYFSFSSIPVADRCELTWNLPEAKK